MSIPLHGSLDFLLLCFTVVRLAVNSCGVPVAPMNGSIRNYTGTAPGDSVTFTCDKFFVPTYELTGVCMSELGWIPSPEKHMCILDGMYYSYTVQDQ